MDAAKYTEREFHGKDGTRFAYVDEGSGSPILLLHGWSGSLRWFNHNIATLARDHRVVAFDYRGHGSSDKTESGHTMARYAQDVHDIVEGLELGRPLMAGWSMGSIVLWNYIQQFGQGQASGMVFIGQSASDLITADYEHGIMTMDDLPRLDQRPADRPRAVRARQHAGDGQARADAEELDWMTADYLRTPAHIAALALYQQTVENALPAFPTIDFPTQVYFGTDPKMYRIEHGQLAGGRDPGHRARRVRGQRPRADVGGAGPVQRDDAPVRPAAGVSDAVSSRAAALGEPVPRREDARLLRGEGRFVADIRAPARCMPRSCARRTRTRLLHGLEGIGEARAAPGVVAVLTSADVAGLGPLPVKRPLIGVVAGHRRAPAVPGAATASGSPASRSRW